MAAATAPITQWSPTKKHSEAERWICIYPAYINSKKSRQEGRRLPKDNCVENPTFQEIKDVLSVCNVRFGVENKLYPRERSKELQFRGRIRIQLRNDDGTPFNPQFPTRDSLMLHLGSMIPQLKSRQGGARAAEVQPQQSSASGGSKKGKGGKRR
ncbi:hypothetical protein HA402_002905 [Bradysia odoriphaga]|nr:hypothetical protein HA402_002905 [Bradysia odoriphaga]